MNRDVLDGLTREFASAEEIYRHIKFQCEERIPDTDEDWLWMSLVCLWERWFPDGPSLEMIDDSMQEGYAVPHDDDVDAERVRIWTKTWCDILTVMDVHQIETLPEFDDRFAGTQSVFNWITDYSDALYNAARHDQQFLRNHIDFCETVLLRLGEWREDHSWVGRELAEAWFRAGNRERGEELFARLTRDDPREAWNWIVWSDCYCCDPDDPVMPYDAARAEQLLLQGLAVPDVDDRQDLLERLCDLYDELDRDDDLEAAQQELDELDAEENPWRYSDEDDDLPPLALSFPPVLERPSPFEVVAADDHVFPDDDYLVSADADVPGAPLEASFRVGRNDPCPCGSGKKFKKCCLRK